MSTDITMQELEFETAELLPARETLWSSGSWSSSTRVDTGNGDHDGNGDGNGGGFLSPSILSGDGNGDLDGNTVVVF